MNRTILLGAAGVTLSAIVIVLKSRRNKQRQRRKYKVRPLNRERKTKGFFNATFLKIETSDPEQFFKYTRMSVKVFNKLCMMVTPFTKRRDCEDTVCPRERLAITLHYLSQGSSMQTIAWAYQLGLTTVHCIVHEMCKVLWEVLSPHYLKPPSSTPEWNNILHVFNVKWNFPNCLGAIDGKHVTIQAPALSGSLYFNYKKAYSIVLMASCDGNYFFTMVDIGGYGSLHDSRVFQESIFGKTLETNGLKHIPIKKHIEGIDGQMPCVFVADEAFPLKQYIMRPFPGSNLSVMQRIFNYRLSRARPCIENTFGVLVARWRILKTTINAKVENVDNIVKACVCLHNFVKRQDHANANIRTSYCPPGYVDSGDVDNGLWRQETDNLRSVGRLAANNASTKVYKIRDNFAQFFVSQHGRVPWQLDYINRGSVIQYVYND